MATILILIVIFLSFLPGTASNAGAAYVFVRPSGDVMWSRQGLLRELGLFWLYGVHSSIYVWIACRIMSSVERIKPGCILT